MRIGIVGAGKSCWRRVIRRRSRIW
jgi:hypothetical protein